MSNVSEITTGNVFRIVCARHALFAAGASENFDTIAITPLHNLALTFDKDAAEKGRKVLAALYPSFDWQVQ